MPEYTLTEDQQVAVGDMLKKSERSQELVTTLANRSAAAHAPRDAGYVCVQQACGNVLGLSAFPATVTELHLELGEDGAWTGKIAVNQAL